MKASELRIGNWVWNDVQEIPVKVDVRIISQQTYRKPNQGLWEPIPLTEEWLLKFGFEEERVEGNQGDFNVYRKGFITFNTSHNGWWINSSPSPTNPKHVHQLQNLYFALTGQELTI